MVSEREWVGRSVFYRYNPKSAENNELVVNGFNAAVALISRFKSANRVFYERKKPFVTKGVIF